MTHPILDQPDVLQALFHPRQEDRFDPIDPRTRRVAVEVESTISVRGRLYPAAFDSPAILFFHGNGEIAADYDYIAKFFTQLGITLLVIDYRGYGASDGTPTASTLLQDAVTVFKALGGIFTSNQLNPKQVYVMGRSLGSAAAIEVALYAGNSIAGLIIDSGFAQTFELLACLGVEVKGVDEERDGVGNLLKMGRITTPTLIIHGQDDVLIPVKHAQDLYHCCAAQNKQLVVIANVGHNTVMMFGREQYFLAIKKFVNP
ncbi:MAG TPA: alpha/beta hydrolase [Cyanobacteria bacterium UBA12227]|nr:alpha/beta hydrolase [Cyanobacteria bacterium UBA12227]HAX88915.1 alpha/beta hydrolase [Cyanobacteria bacterium UBA11370]HBY80115.1 alpha/beta hydrolase [Cyanobacteria bacterium UBA11148]